MGLGDTLYLGETGAVRKAAGETGEQPYIYICEISS